MKIEYVRNLQSSFMRVVLEEELPKTEEEMLERNQIEGLLPVTLQKEDNGYLLRYDITGKQALDIYLDGKMVDEVLLTQLLQEICSVCKRVERYLLSIEGIMLSPETIFWDYKKEKFYFCYYPEEKEDLQIRFTRLMEYMLTKTDHKNVRAVEMVYGVYEELMQPAYNIIEIQKRMETVRKSWDEQKEQMRVEETEGGIEERVALKAEEKKEKRPQWRIWLEEKKEMVKKRMDAWIKPDIKNKIKLKGEIEPFVFEPMEEPQKQTLPTVLLSEGGISIQGILKYEGQNLLPDFYITKFPFLIGSDTGCDGVIEDATVSRKHAVITKVDEVYFIEDLNSLNGTIVGGELVSYKTKVSLKKNESIVFANQPYRFV